MSRGTLVSKVAKWHALTGLLLKGVQVVVV